jgi:tetratricopeptide (TPR) repeat protein
MGAIHSAYKAGDISDVDLRAAFRVFYSTDPELDAHYREWTRQSPKSYVAHLARGVYFKKLGQELLGDKSFGTTSGEEAAAIREAFRLAREELNASLLLDDKPLLSYLHLINICQFLGDQQGAHTLIGPAIAIDPQNYIVRESYMILLETQHGGSGTEMRAFLSACRGAGLSMDQLNALEALVFEDEAWVHRNVDGDTDAAILAYQEAARLNPASSCLPCGPVMQSANLLLEAKNYAAAVEQYSKVLAFDANSMSARNGRAFAELQLQQPTLAVDDFTYCANRGNAYARDM